jgi:hypothetical protein
VLKRICCRGRGGPGGPEFAHRLQSADQEEGRRGYEEAVREEAEEGREEGAAVLRRRGGLLTAPRPTTGAHASVSLPLSW